MTVFDPYRCHACARSYDQNSALETQLLCEPPCGARLRFEGRLRDFVADLVPIETWPPSATASRWAYVFDDLLYRTTDEERREVLTANVTNRSIQELFVTYGEVLAGGGLGQGEFDVVKHVVEFIRIAGESSEVEYLNSAAQRIDAHAYCSASIEERYGETIFNLYDQTVYFACRALRGAIAEAITIADRRGSFHSS